MYRCLEAVITRRRVRTDTHVRTTRGSASTEGHVRSGVGHLINRLNDGSNIILTIAKKLIHSLNQGEGMIEGHKQLKDYNTKYYTSLFGAP